MMLRSLPPAGNPISLKRSAEPLDDLLPGYTLTWVDSGTAALAYSLLQIKEQQPQIEAPEVIVPGYCCPDLLSAAIHAGFKPVIVDICEDDPSYNLVDLEGSLTENTLAVIAINFLGIKERLADIRKIIANYPLISIIEDNAQWFPDEGEVQDLDGDYVTFSFGRGKAVSILGGGLVATRKGIATRGYSAVSTPKPSTLLRLKVTAYNFLLHPFFYYWLQKMPFITLGKTEYKPLDGVSLLPSESLAYIGKNILEYRSRSVDKKNTSILDESIGKLSALNTTLAERSNRLLRFPFLCQSPEQRERLVIALEQNGMGASRMYVSSLDKVDGVAPLLDTHKPLEYSQKFAERLLTLPVHAGVTAGDLDAISRIIHSMIGEWGR